MEKTSRKNIGMYFYSVPLYVLIPFIIASSIFGMLYVLSNSHIQGWNIIPNDDEYTKQKNFYADLNPKENKGFLLGSSQIWALNTTYIQQYLSQNNQNYTIYNLAINANTPTSRLGTINMIIAARPNFVVYGVSDLDFWNQIPISATDQFLKNQPIVPILPDPHSIFKYSLGLDTLFDFHTDLIQSPKFVFLRNIGDYEVVPFTHVFQALNSPYPNVPFFSIADSNFFKIKNDTEIENILSRDEVFNFDPAPINENALDMIEIIEKLKENHIKVIIFTTPQNHYHIEDMGNDRIKQFDDILNYISTQTDTPIYQLYDKYENLPIFTDQEHVAINENSIIYSQDVAKMIQSEIGK